jgi:hypothetical protein
MTIELIDQFIISDEHIITAQELFKVDEWSHLFIGHLSHPPRLKTVRYIFILRSYSKKTQKWVVFDIDIKKKRRWAQRKFDKNKEHILKYRSVSP